MFFRANSQPQGNAFQHFFNFWVRQSKDQKRGR